MKPILFNTEMVRAILDDRKKVTRRVVKPQSLCRKPPIQQKGHPEYWANWDDEKIYKAPYNPGDILYVRETFAKIRDWTTVDPDVGMFDGYIYKADWMDGVEHPKWKSSTQMPREAARIFLRVTDVRVERLQDMQPYDIAFEGFRRQRDFMALWDSTIKKDDQALYGWAANPWVWVIAFERVRKEDAENGLQRAD